MYDFIGKNGVQGEVANFVANHGTLGLNMKRPYIGSDGRTYVTVNSNGKWKAQPVQVNAVLRRDEWKTLDTALLPIAESRLNAVQLLREKGLTYMIGNGMGSTVLEYHTISDAMEASLTMDGITRSKGDRVLFSTNYIPLPITHVDYEINARVLAASRSLGNPLDVSNAERAARKVNEKLEQMLVTNTSYGYGGGTIYSLVNEPNRNKYTITAWDGSGKTAAQIKDDVLGMKKAAIADHYYGPYTLLIPTDYETVLDDDFDIQTPGTTIRERLLKIEGINEIKVVDTLPDDTVILVQMTSDVIRLVDGMPMQNVQWDVEGGMNFKFKVMTIQVPQIRADYNGASGVVHATTA